MPKTQPQPQLQRGNSLRDMSYLNSLKEKVEGYLRQAESLRLEIDKAKFAEILDNWDVKVQRQGAAINLPRIIGVVENNFNQNKDEKLRKYLQVLEQMKKNSFADVGQVNARIKKVNLACDSLVPGLDEAIHVFLGKVFFEKLNGILSDIKYSQDLVLTPGLIDPLLSNALRVNLGFYIENGKELSPGVLRFNKNSQSWINSAEALIQNIAKMAGGCAEAKADAQLLKLAHIGSMVAEEKEILALTTYKDGLEKGWNEMDAGLKKINRSVCGIKELKNWSELATSGESIEEINKQYEKNIEEQETFLVSWYSDQYNTLSDSLNGSIDLLNDLESACFSLDQTPYSGNYSFPTAYRNSLGWISNRLVETNGNSCGEDNKVGKAKINSINETSKYAGGVYADIAKEVDNFKSNVISVWNTTLNSSVQELNAKKDDLAGCIMIATENELISNELGVLYDFEHRFKDFSLNSKANVPLTLLGAVQDLKSKQSDLDGLQSEFKGIEQDLRGSIVQKLVECRTKVDESLATTLTKLTNTPEWFNKDFIDGSEEIKAKLNELQISEKFSAKELEAYIHQLKVSENDSSCLLLSIESKAIAKVAEFDNAINSIYQLVGKSEITIADLDSAVRSMQDLKNQLNEHGVSGIFLIAKKSMESTQKSLNSVTIIVLEKIKLQVGSQFKQIEEIRTSFNALQGVSSKLGQADIREKRPLHNEKKQLKGIKGANEPTTQQVKTLQKIDDVLGEKKKEVAGEISRLNSEAKKNANALIKQKNEIEASIKVEKEFCGVLSAQGWSNKSSELEGISDRCSRVQINGKNGRNKSFDINILKDKAARLHMAQTTIGKSKAELSGLKAEHQKIAKQQILEWAGKVLKKVQDLQVKIAPLSDAFKKEAVESLKVITTKVNGITVKDHEDLSKDKLETYIKELNTVSNEFGKQESSLQENAENSVEDLNKLFAGVKEKVVAVERSAQEDVNKENSADVSKYLNQAREAINDFRVNTLEQMRPICEYYDKTGVNARYKKFYDYLKEADAQLIAVQGKLDEVARDDSQKYPVLGVILGVKS